nr:hypothetical protein Iba_scaffold745765CG0010 [Ipomoea batatas]GME10658.1 hypothetical protein Iba_scaffold10379CG0020 [Ipomoea batatas]
MPRKPTRLLHGTQRRGGAAVVGEVNRQFFRRVVEGQGGQHRVHHLHHGLLAWVRRAYEHVHSGQILAPGGEIFRPDGPRHGAPPERLREDPDGGEDELGGEESENGGEVETCVDSAEDSSGLLDCACMEERRGGGDGGHGDLSFAFFFCS